MNVFRGTPDREPNRPYAAPINGLKREPEQSHSATLWHFVFIARSALWDC